MKKTVKILWSIFFAITMLTLGAMLADKKYLRENIVRVHIRANSDSVADQQEKLAVRDSLLQSLRAVADEVDTAAQAQMYLSDRLPELEDCANAILTSRGSQNRAKITLREEAFPTRVYESFSLPAGVYDSLIVEIGNAQGENWWCVAFPSLCLQDFYAAAAAIDMEQDVQNTLTGERGYQIRFFLLECLGKIENFFMNS